MNYIQLVELIKSKKSFLCVGLDTDLEKIPSHLYKFEDPIFEFNTRIIDATSAYTVAYKPNLAFYEANGAWGWNSLKKTVDYIRNKYPEIFLIADAKRGDIGNTCEMYAKAFFEHMDFDAVTITPYMGVDSVKPFLQYRNKWVIVLALTSNQSANDFQMLIDKNSSLRLFEKVIQTAMNWGSIDNLMFVAGATKASMLQDIRKIIPQHFLLVPGVGAQGGSLEEVCQNALTSNCGLLVNSSRQIIYANKGLDFQQFSTLEAQKIQTQMKNILLKNNIL